jgi:Protein of unknown function (DUF1501)
MTRRLTDCEGFHRRDFLKIGATGLLGLGLPDLLRLEAQAGRAGKRRADSVILVWLAGGPATIDMWDLKPGAPTGGEFKPINTSAPGVQISEHLPNTAKMMDRATIVRSLFHTIPSHSTGTIWMTTGNKPTPALQYPVLGSLTAKLMPGTPGVPKFVNFGNVRGNRGGPAGYLGTAYNPFIVEGNASKSSSLRVRGVELPNGFTLDQLADRDGLRETFDETFRSLDRSSDMVDGFDAFHKQALDILRSPKTRQAFDLDKESAALRKLYGTNSFGQSALAARRLVEAGVRFVTISMGGWDTHSKNFDALKKQRLPQLDQTLSTLVGDLSERGLLDRTVVYCAGEFGRTPKINKKVGRDHWSRSMAVFLAGGGFKKGYAHGTTDSNGMAPATEACSPDDIAATVFHNLGIDPRTELTTPTNRPIQLFREGHVIEKILG